MKATYYSTSQLMRTLALSIVILAVLLILTNSCAPKAFPVSPNPLDEPGYVEPTASELHLKNIRAITQNPSYQAR